MMGRTSPPSGTARLPVGGRKSFWTSIIRSAEEEDDEDKAEGDMLRQVGVGVMIECSGGGRVDRKGGGG